MTLPGGMKTLSFWSEVNVVMTSLLNPKPVCLELYVETVEVFYSIYLGLIEVPSEIIYPATLVYEMIHLFFTV